MTDTQAAGADEPVNINALGPQTAAEQASETRTFANNPEAFDAKQEEAMKAQTAPNPTTDIDLATEAYGEDWNRRRGHKLIATASETPGEIEGEGDTEALYEHGGSVVDNVGHVLGHTTDLPQAVAAKRGLGSNGEIGRYPVTAEAQAEELRRANEDGQSASETKTLDGGLGVAVEPAQQAEHDRQVLDIDRDDEDEDDEDDSK